MCSGNSASRIGITLLLCAISAVCFGDVSFLVSNNSEIELSEANRAELSRFRARFSRDPPSLLVQSMEGSDAEVVLVGRPNNDRASLVGFIEYPDVTVDSLRTFQPRVICRGSLETLSWHYCSDASETWLRVPGLGSVAVDHEAISVQTVNRMREVIDAAELRSPSGVPIPSSGIRSVQYIDSSGDYAVHGETPNGEQFTFQLALSIDSGVETYRVSEWTCQ